MDSLIINKNVRFNGLKLTFKFMVEKYIEIDWLLSEEDMEATHYFENW